MNVADLLSERARRAPDDVAILSDAGPLSSAAVDAAVWVLTKQLRESGLKPGDVVGLRLRDPLLHLLSIFALARCGIVQLPLHPAGMAGEDAVLARVRATAIVTDLPVAAANAAANAVTAPWRSIVLDPALPFEAQGSAASAADPSLRHDLSDHKQQDHPFSFKTSSGTTGTPKLIATSHADMIASMARVQAEFGHLPGEVFFTSIGLNMDGPRRRYMACLVSGGIALTWRKPLDVPSLFALIDRFKVRHFGCLPNHAVEMLDAVPPGKPRFADMRCFRLSAAPSDSRLRALVRERLCPNLVISYGCSEIGPVTSADPELVARSPGTVGRPVPGVALEIVDASDMPVPAGTTGVVRLRAEGMADGYVDDPEATARHFRQGWFYPGDLGVLSADGELKLLGRADDMMIFDGLKIAPLEIEAVLLQHPAVREAAAFPLRSARSFQLPAAAVVLAEEVPVAELRRFAEDRLGRRAPLLLLAMRKLPRNPNGKIMKRELAEAAEQHLQRSKNGAPGS